MAIQAQQSYRDSGHLEPLGELEDRNPSTPIVVGRSLSGSSKRHQKRGRENPLDAPGLLLKLVDGPWTAKLEETVALIDALPSEFVATFPKYVDPAFVRDLRRLTRGMRKMHENIAPFREELDVLSGPDATLEPLSRQFRSAAYCEPISPELEKVVRFEIAAVLEKASEDLRWRGGNYGVAEWAVEAADNAEPEPA